MLTARAPRPSSISTPREDEKHTQEALATLERLGAESRLQVEKSLEQTTYAYLAILRDIESSSRAATEFIDDLHRGTHVRPATGRGEQPF